MNDAQLWINDWHLMHLGHVAHIHFVLMSLSLPSRVHWHLIGWVWNRRRCRAVFRLISTPPTPRTQNSRFASLRSDRVVHAPPRFPFCAGVEWRLSCVSSNTRRSARVFPYSASTAGFMLLPHRHHPTTTPLCSLSTHP